MIHSVAVDLPDRSLVTLLLVPMAFDPKPENWY
jgi:hypothetical protein